MKTREQVKAVAIDMVHRDGLINLSRSGLCAKAGIADGSFPHIMGCSFSDLCKELQDEGVKADAGVKVVTKTRANPTMRREHILQAAAEVALKGDYTKISRAAVANRAGVSDSLVSRYFTTMPKFRRALMRYAVHNEIVELVAQGLAHKDSNAQGAPEPLRSEALKHLSSF